MPGLLTLLILSDLKPEDSPESRMARTDCDPGPVELAAAIPVKTSELSDWMEDNEESVVSSWSVLGPMV